MHWDDIHQAIKALTGRAKVAKDVAEAAGRIFDRAPFTVPIDFDPHPFSVDAYCKAAEWYFREPLSAGRYITRRERPKLSFSDLIPAGQTPGDLMMSGSPLTLAEIVDLPPGSVVLAARGRKFSAWMAVGASTFKRVPNDSLRSGFTLKALELTSQERVVLIKRAAKFSINRRVDAYEVDDPIEPTPSRLADQKPLMDAGEMTRSGWSAYED